MNKFLSYVNLSLELYVVWTFWLGSNTSGTISLDFAQPSYELQRPALKTLLWYRTDICSCKLSAKVSLMLDNPFPVPFLYKLSHISICFIQFSTRITYKQLIPFRESSVFLWSHPWCFGPLGKFQHDMKISIKTALVSRLSVTIVTRNNIVWKYGP